MNKAIQDMISRFHTEHDYLTSGEMNRIYRYALGIYLTKAFPYDKSITEFPDKCTRDIYIVELLMQDLLERNGCTSAVSYTENGLSIDYDTSLVSQEILKLITPQAGIPK
jgi:hypothetical protein